MHIHQLHSWDLPIPEAIALQKKLSQQIETSTPLGPYELVAGSDVSFSRGSDIFFATVVVLRAEDCSVVEVQNAVGLSPFPYIPGLLSFREAPILLQAFSQVKSKVDVVMVDGQGIAHPRGLGIASHLGLFLEVPCVGCAKSLLYGHYLEPEIDAGSISPLKNKKDEIIGQVVRTKKRVKPVFVSPGHRIDMASSVRLTLDLCKGYRLPEPTRQAHLLVNQFRREQGENPQNF